MMGSSAPAAGDFDKALALIAAVADPEAVKARLIEISTAENSASERIKQAGETDAQLASQLSDLASQKAAFANEMEAERAAVDKQIRDADSKAQKLAEQQRLFDADRVTLDQFRRAFAVEQEQLKLAQSAVRERERLANEKVAQSDTAMSEAVAANAAAGAIKAEYESKIKRLAQSARDALNETAS